MSKPPKRRFRSRIYPGQADPLAACPFSVLRCPAECRKGGAWEMDGKRVRENRGDVIEGAQDCANPDFSGLTPDELDEVIARQAEQIQRERNKRQILALLEEVPAESDLWDQVLVMLAGTVLLETREG